MKHLLTAILSVGLTPFIWAQELEQSESSRYWLDGFSRTWFTSDALLEEQTSTGAISSGWNLLDLNPHVNPTPALEVFAQVRVLNEFGGFFGQGTQVDVRQLRVSGVVEDKVKFNVGDIYLHQSEFTLHAEEGEVDDGWGHAFEAQRRLVSYENFFVDNRWRMQGAQANVAFRGDRGLERFVIDGYVTRPLGSKQLSEGSYTPDRVLAGITSAAVFQEGWSGELHHAVLADLPNSGTAEYHVLNPVTHGKIEKQQVWRDISVRWIAEGGGSNHAWRIRDLANSELDSLYGGKTGAFAGLSGRFVGRDSTWQGYIGYREVDPFFRSAGAQSKRYDFSEEASPSVFPLVGSDEAMRSVSVFDVLSDVTIANQSISATLMPIAPLFENVLPFGRATPNRRGFEAGLRRQSKWMTWKLNGSWFQELTGQGTAEQRSFTNVGVGVEWEPSVSAKRSCRLSAFEKVQHTHRGGSDLEKIDLFTSNFTFSAELELWPQVWVECSGRHAIGRGSEFLNVRSELGELYNFRKIDLDTQAWMTSMGIKHHVSNDVMAQVQWNLWGQDLGVANQSRLLASQLFIVISATL